MIQIGIKDARHCIETKKAPPYQGSGMRRGYSLGDVTERYTLAALPAFVIVHFLHRLIR